MDDCSKKLNSLTINEKDKKYRIVDLFAGTGAFSHVFQKYDHECVFANDMMDISQKVYNLNHDNVKLTIGDLNDIAVTDIPAHDILCGGFPCQPFSIAGKQHGFDDKRSNVFWKILEILRHHKPKIIVLENVKNLTSHDKGKTYTTIINKLKEIGYYIISKVLDTAIVTPIPQHRERIYIVGFLDEKKYSRFDLSFPEIRSNKITDYLEKQKVGDKYYYTDRLKIYDTVNKNVKKHITENTLYQYRRYYVRENKSNCCPTLTANMGTGGHNVPLLKDDHGIRKLTPRECFNLQGFPPTFSLPPVSNSSLYKLAGNAVSLPVIELIVQRLSQL